MGSFLVTMNGLWSHMQTRRVERQLVVCTKVAIKVFEFIKRESKDE